MHENDGSGRGHGHAVMVATPTDAPGTPRRDSGVTPMEPPSPRAYRGDMTPTKTTSSTSTSTPDAPPALDSTATVAVAPAAANPADSQVLGILALVSSLTGILFGLVVPLSIVGIVLGVVALSREPRSRTMATWAIVTGVIPFALGLFALIIGVSIAIPFGLWAFAGAI